MVPYNSEMDALQRDGMPEEEEPKEGACWNCLHAADVIIGGKCYIICVQERDDRSGGQFGDVHECDFGLRECEHWALYEL